MMTLVSFDEAMMYLVQCSKDRLQKVHLTMLQTYTCMQYTGCGIKNNPLRKIKFFKNY